MPDSQIPSEHDQVVCPQQYLMPASWNLSVPNADLGSAPLNDLFDPVQRRVSGTEPFSRGFLRWRVAVELIVDADAAERCLFSPSFEPCVVGV